MDNQERLRLAEEISALEAQIFTDDRIAQMAADSLADYNRLLSEIEEKYSQKLAQITSDKDLAVSNATATIAVAQRAIADAGVNYDAAFADLEAEKSKLSAEADAYYDQLKQRDADVMRHQAELVALLEQKKARCAELEAEEARHISAQYGAEARPKIRF